MQTTRKTWIQEHQDSSAVLLEAMLRLIQKHLKAASVPYGSFEIEEKQQKPCKDPWGGADLQIKPENTKWKLDTHVGVQLHWGDFTSHPDDDFGLFLNLYNISQPKGVIRLCSFDLWTGRAEGVYYAIQHFEYDLETFEESLENLQMVTKFLTSVKAFFQKP